MKNQTMEVRRKMEKPKNKPADKIEDGRISLLRWENSNKYGEPFTSFSLVKTIRRRSEDDPSKFEEQLFPINGLKKEELKAIKSLIDEMMEGEEEAEYGWSQ